MGFIPSDYVPVADRVSKFRNDHPDWGLSSEILINDGSRVVVKATVTDDSGLVKSTGHAEEVRDGSPVNKTSAIENCETSAWGRALAALGYEVRGGIASREEMQKTQRQSSGGRQSGSSSDRQDTGAQSSRASAESAPASPELIEEVRTQVDALTDKNRKNLAGWWGAEGYPKTEQLDKNQANAVLDYVAFLTESVA